MWLFTKYGFFSAVSARQGDGEHGRPVDPTRIMVRARVRDHLEQLVKRFPHHLDDCEIQERTTTDYGFYLFMEKRVWAEVVGKIITDLEYDNFESEVARFQGKAGKDYEQALHEVWSVMLRLQG
jgi:hypothetical protein